MSSTLLSLGLSAQVIWTEDFSTATGVTPPTGWTATDLATSGVNWVFDNPGERDVLAPMTDPVAVLDSDFFGGEFPEDAVLLSPVFNASTITGSIVLEFDHTFIQYETSVWSIEVFDGTSWNEVLTGDEDIEEPAHEYINITAAADGATNAQVRFRFTGFWDLYWMVDNVSLTEVSCVSPTAITVTAADDNSVDLSWTAGSETDWNIEYGPTGFTPGAGTPDVATGTPEYEVSGLDPLTEYDFYVQADCGGGEESTWTGPFTFSTTCVFPVISTLPWTEDFDGVTDPEIPCGWVTEDGNDDDITWVTDTYSAVSSPNALIIFYNENEDMNDWVYTPELVLQSGTSYRFSFQQRIDTDEYPENLSVSIGTAANSAAMTTQLLDFPGLVNGTYVERYVDFTVPANGSYHIGFHGYSDADMSAIFIDDVSLDLSPSCIEPTDVTVDAITTSGAEISWTAGGTETTWNIEYGPAGFTAGSGTPATVTGTPEYILSTLDPNTDYDFYVQTDCGAGDESNWTMISFTTNCEAISTFPWSENFDAEEVPELPCGWSVEDVNGDDVTWINYDYNSNSGLNALYIQYNADEDMNDWAYSPELVMQSGVNYQLQFSYVGSATIFPENLGVFIGTAQANASMTTELIALEGIVNDTFITVTVDFTVPANDSYYIGFHGYSDADMFYMAVDDISVTVFDCDPESAAFTLAEDTLCADGPVVTPVVTGNTGGTFSGTTGLTFNATTGAVTPATSSPGNHVLTYITSTTDCADTMTFALVVEVCDLGISETALATIELFPNPTNGLLHVKSPASNGALTVAVVDFSGKTVLVLPGSVTGAFDIDLSSLENGVYFVNFISEGARQTQRVVLTK